MTEREFCLTSSLQRMRAARELLAQSLCSVELMGVTVALELVKSVSSLDKAIEAIEPLVFVTENNETNI